MPPPSQLIETLTVMAYCSQAEVECYPDRIRWTRFLQIGNLVCYHQHAARYAAGKGSMKHLWDPQLSDREVHFIGMIFIQWADLEHELFVQTLQTFLQEGRDTPQLPKEMNNIQFSGVLELWKQRVADKGPQRRTKVLQRQYEKIRDLRDARDALTHGMWYWSMEDLGRISTTRVKKRQIITSHFTVKALGDMAVELGQINFKVRFSGGLADLAKAQIVAGGYVSRRAVRYSVGPQLTRRATPPLIQHAVVEIESPEQGRILVCACHENEMEYG